MAACGACALIGSLLNARSLLVRSLSYARKLAADGGAPGSLRSRRPVAFFIGLLLTHSNNWEPSDNPVALPALPSAGSRLLTVVFLVELPVLTASALDGFPPLFVRPVPLHGGRQPGVEVEA